MDTTDRKLLGEPPFPTRELWRALLLIHHHYLVDEPGTRRPRRVPPQVVEAVRLLDCYIEKAIKEGWCENENTVV